MPNDNDKSLSTEHDDALDADKNAESKGTEESGKKTNAESKTEEGKTSSADSKTFSEDYVKDLRKESATYRQKAKELQEKAEQAEKKIGELSQSSEAAKLEAKKALEETKRLHKSYEQRIINAELKTIAVQEGLLDMDAFKMVDLSNVKIADNGDVSGVKELISNLKKEKPYLFKPVTTANANAGEPGADKNKGEKPTYKDKKEFDEAKAKFFGGLR